MTDHQLIELSAKSDLPLIVSTGMSTLEDVDSVVAFLEKVDKQNYVLLHTVSVYPAEHSLLNLRVIPMMQKRYPCIIGYSGHEDDLEPSIVAAAFGAQIIERHITLDNSLWGTDQKASLPVLAMDMLGKRIASIFDCLGNGEKTIIPQELEARNKLRG